MSSEIVRNLVLFFPAWLVSLCVHEYAHAWTATKLGDATPARQGRLTVSPASHIDIFGSLILPGVAIALGSGFFFGWAKPVEYNPANFTRKLTRWQGDLITALAGPASNVILAFFAALGLKIAMGQGLSSDSFAFGVLQWLLLVNVLLAVFNLLPLPPLDGGRLIPDSMAELRDTLTRYALFIFILLFLVPIPGLGGSIGALVVHPAMMGLAAAMLWLAGLIV